jgi:hypothetical protein
MSTFQSIYRAGRGLAVLLVVLLVVAVAWRTAEQARSIEAERVKTAQVCAKNPDGQRCELRRLDPRTSDQAGGTR